MPKTLRVNFDMDGTIANLYGVENWLPMLLNEDTTPYEMAKPLVHMPTLARHLNSLSRKGYEINIISWTAKGGSKEYNERVAKAKRKWLAKHLPSVNFTNIYIVEYGTPKCSLANGILFDDEKPNRKEWNGIAFDEENINEILKLLVSQG